VPFANHVMLAHREETCILVGVSIQNLYGKGKKMHLSSIDCGKIFFLPELPLLWPSHDIK
jgi:hypothetical protein